MACHQMTCHLPNDVECGHVSEPPHTTVCQKLACGCGEKSSHAGEVQDQVGTWCHCHRVGVLIRECNCHQFVVDPHGNPHHCQGVRRVDVEIDMPIVGTWPTQLSSPPTPCGLWRVGPDPYWGLAVAMRCVCVLF